MIDNIIEEARGIVWNGIQSELYCHNIMMILTLSPFCKPPSTCWILIEIALIEITLLHCLSYATTVAANVTTVAANTTNVAADATNVAANATTVAANATNVAANVTNVAADATPHEVGSFIQSFLQVTSSQKHFI